MSKKPNSKQELLSRVAFLEETVNNLLLDKERLIQELKLHRRRMKMASIFLDTESVFTFGEPPE